MASTTTNAPCNDGVQFNVHGMDWKQSISKQLQHRKATEQTPFEDIYSFACNMFDKVDIYKSENIQLNLQREQLQQQLLKIEQTILAEGIDAAKTIFSKLSSAGLSEGEAAIGSVAAKNLNLQYATLLNEKSQLEKKILELQDRLTDALKSESETAKKLVELKTELDEKDKVNRHLTSLLSDRDREVAHLREVLENLNKAYKTLEDEHTALKMASSSVEKQLHQSKIDLDALRIQLLKIKREDAERLNAENDRIIQLQRERIRKETETNVAELNQRIGDTSSLALGSDNFDTLDDEEYLSSSSLPSKIPSSVELSFDAHESEVAAVNWYCCGGPRDNFLATGGTDRKVKIWKIAEGASSPVATLLGSNASITSIDVEADALIASSNDYATRVWSVNDYKLRRTLTGHSSKVCSAKFLGVPHKIASGSLDRTIKVWDVNQGACIKTYFAGSSCYDLIYNSYQVISGHFDKKIRCWDLKQPNHNESISEINLDAKITSLDISKDGTKVLCSLRDNTIKCLDLRKLEVLQTYLDEKFRICTDFSRAKFSIDGQYICCGSNDGSLYIWDANTTKVAKILPGSNSPVMACSWSPDGKRMVSIDRSKRVFIWL